MEGGASDIIVMMYNVYTVNHFFHTHFIYTVDWEIFAVKNFLSAPYEDEN